MRIIQYENPFELIDIIVEKGLMSVTHLTVSQTLLNGISDLAGDQVQLTLSTVDNFLKESYPSWYGDHSIDNDINKLTYINNFIRNIQDTEVRKSFTENKGDLIKSLNALREFDIPTSELKDIYNHEGVLSHFNDLYESIMKEAFFRINKNNSFKDSTYVFHSIHQFSPLICRLISEMESAGVNIIFLYNYMEDFHNVYNTWIRVYNEFDHHTVSTELVKNKGDNKHTGVGVNIGHYLNGSLKELKEFSELKIESFRTLTEFSRKVELSYENALKRREKDQVANVSNKDKDDKKRISPMAYMDVQYYSVKGEDSNKLLKVIYPEQFKERHFLSYPLGQFFLNLYNLWDEDKNQLIMSQEIKSILSYDIWGCTPISFFDCFKNYFDDDLYIDEYINYLNNIIDTQNILNSEYKKMKDRSKKIPGSRSDIIRQYNRFPFLSLKRREIQMYIDVLTDIKKIAEEIFIHTEDKIMVKAHFKTVITKLENRHNFDALETQLVDAVSQTIDGLDSKLSANKVGDLKEALHYFLNESKENKENKSNWIVRDLEQLDGEVLYSNRENRSIQLSQLKYETIDMRVEEKQIWPLDEIMKLIDYNGKYLSLYKTSRNEYKYFLMYMIFYGSYYSKKNVIYSYDRISGDKHSRALEMFSFLGFKDSPYYREQKRTSIEFSRNAMRRGKYCPYRTAFERVKSDGKNDIYKDLMQQYRMFKNLFAFMIIEKMIIRYYNNELMTNDERYMRDIINKEKEILRKLSYIIFDHWTKVKIDELINDSMEYNFERSYKLIINNITGNARRDMGLLTQHSRFIDTKFKNLIYDPVRYVISEDKEAKLQERMPTIHMFYPDANLKMCHSCIYRQDCLVDYLEYDSIF